MRLPAPNYGMLGPDSGMLAVPESRSAIVGNALLVNVEPGLWQRNAALSELQKLPSNKNSPTNVWTYCITAH
jgi:hypothetical protein